MGNSIPSTSMDGSLTDDVLLKNADSNLILIGSALTPPNNKFLRSLVYKSPTSFPSTLNVLKYYFIRGTDTADVQACIALQKEVLSQKIAPNVLLYQRCQGTASSSTPSPSPGISSSSSSGGSSSFPTFVTRQYFFANLKDRLSTRPFLSDMEKLWIAYSLIHACCQLHSNGFAHGDIKSENVVISSWGWVCLTDLAAFKPTFLHADQSAAPFNFYFTSGQKKRCYIAPERFLNANNTAKVASSKESAKRKFTESMMNSEEEMQKVVALMSEASSVEKDPSDWREAQIAKANQIGKGTSADRVTFWRKKEVNGDLLPSMDVFSVGCVLGELFNADTESTFELSDMLHYSAKGESPRLQSILSKIENEDIRGMVQSMTSIDPASRLKMEEYLTSKAFPPSFTTFLYPFMHAFLKEDELEDALVWKTCEKYRELIEMVCGIHDEQGSSLFETLHRDRVKREEMLFANNNNNNNGTGQSSTFHNADEISFDNIDQLIKELENKLDEAISSSSLSSSKSSSNNNIIKKDTIEISSNVLKPPLTIPISEMKTTKKNFQNNNEEEEEATFTNKDAVNIVLNYLSVSLQFSKKPSIRVLSLMLIQRLCGLCGNDDIILSRVLPVIVDRLENDHSPWVRSCSLKVMTYLLELIEQVPVSEFKLFPDFLIPVLYDCSRDSSDLVRVTFASCLPSVATHAKRFLEHAHADLRDHEESNGGGGGENGTTNTSSSSSSSRKSTINYDADLNNLHDSFQKMIEKIVATDPTTGADFAVKNALISQIMKLCMFFGRDRIDRWLLPWLLSIFNINIKGIAQWRLQVSVLHSLSTIGAFVGSEAFDIFFPLIDDMLSIQNLNHNDLVVQAACNCLASLTTLELIPRAKLTKIVDKIAPLVRHPSIRVRRSTLNLLSAIATTLSHVDVQIYVAEKLANNNNISKESLLKDTFCESVILLLGKSDFKLQDNALLLEDCIGEPIPTQGKWSSMFNAPLNLNGKRGKQPMMMIPDDMNFNNNNNRTGGRAVLIHGGATTTTTTTTTNNNNNNNNTAVVTNNATTNHSNNNNNVVIGGPPPGPKHQFEKDFKGVVRVHELSINEYHHASKDANNTSDVDELKLVVNRYGIVLDKNMKGRTLLRRAKALALPEMKTNLGRNRIGHGSVLSTNDSNQQNGSKPINRNNQQQQQDNVQGSTANNTRINRTGSSSSSNYPPGTTTTTTINSKNGNNIYSNGSSSTVDLGNIEWKPRGVLVTSLHEHAGPVNRIAVADDSSFFVSGSDDGTAKVWVTSKLDRNPCPRSRVTFETESRVVDASCIKNTSSFAVATDSGRVSLVRVDTTQQFTKNLKMEHNRIVGLESPVTNFLYAGTERGSIVGWDLRSSKKCVEMSLILGLGSVSCMTVSTDGAWLCLGTHRGVIAVFDTRYEMLVVAWRHPCSCAIHRLHCSKSTEGMPLVFVAAGPNQAVLLNLETGDTRYAFASANSEVSDKASLVEWKASQESLFSTKYEQVNVDHRNIDRYVNEAKFLTSSHHPSAFASPHHSVRSILCPCDTSSNGQFRGEPPNVLTAGTDVIIRYWDCASANTSSIVSAPPDEPRMKFESKLTASRGTMYTSVINMTSNNNNNTNRTKAKFAIRPAHTDAILDLAAARIDANASLQTNILISSGRDGVIRVWQ